MMDCMVRGSPSPSVQWLRKQREDPQKYIEWNTVGKLTAKRAIVQKYTLIFMLLKYIYIKSVFKSKYGRLCDSHQSAANAIQTLAFV